jgi:hypothetical protein
MSYTFDIFKSDKFCGFIAWLLRKVYILTGTEISSFAFMFELLADDRQIFWPHNSKTR